MKLKFTLLFFLCAITNLCLYSQNYSQSDIDALKAIQEACDKNSTLNWHLDVPNYAWAGLIWQLDMNGEYRVYSLDLSNKNLIGNLVVKNMSYLNYLDCQNNRLIGLTIENCPVQKLNCSGNQIPISELLKFSYLGSNFIYNPQHAISEEFTSVPRLYYQLLISGRWAIQSFVPQ